MSTGSSDISRPRLKRPNLFCRTLLCTLALLGFSCPAFAQDVRSEGGLIAGSKIVRVSTLADGGRGSLRWALEQCGPCLIVFDVSGVIELQSDLTIERDHVTLAGETAASPGILLYGGTLKIRASDVIASHIGIYPGSATDPKIAENRDGISLYGSESRKRTIRNIILRNISVGWGVDENIGIQGLSDGARIERSLIAQPLRNGGHPKGVHSMNLILSGTTGRVIITGNIFAGSEQRSPRLTTGNRVSMINNLIAGFGYVGTHLDTSQSVTRTGQIDIIGNLYLPSSASYCKNKAIQIDDKFLTAKPQTQVYLSGNAIDDRYKPDCLTLTSADEALLSDKPLTTLRGWTILPAADLLDKLTHSAGSHPLSRNPIDAQVIAQIMDGTIAPIEDDKEVKGLLKQIAPKESVNWGKGLGPVIFAKDIAHLKTSLCKRFKAVSGPYDCPYLP